MEVFIMANGGYTILDFKDKDFTIGTPQKIEGVYSQIENNYSKPIILWGLTINGSAKKALFLNFDKKEGTYTTTEANYIYTISSNDNVLIEEVKNITIEDLIPVIDCEGQTFGQLTSKIVPGAFEKAKNGGPVFIRNFDVQGPMNYRVSDGGFLVNFGFQSTLAQPARIEAIYYHINKTGTNTFKLYKYCICISRNDSMIIWPFDAEDL